MVSEEWILLKIDCRMKSRGIYETPGGTILNKKAIESITLDKGEAHLKDEIPKYAETIYNGFWFSSERIAMQSLIDSTQKGKWASQTQSV